MNRDDVAKRVQAKMAELGIPKHVTQIQKIPSKVEVAVIIDGKAVKLSLRTGITAPELEYKLGTLEGMWQGRMPPNAGKQTDLEELIEERPS